MRGSKLKLGSYQECDAGQDPCIGEGIEGGDCDGGSDGNLRREGGGAGAVKCLRLGPEIIAALKGKEELLL